MDTDIDRLVAYMMVVLFGAILVASSLVLIGGR
jgi:hypothetical protein